VSPDAPVQPDTGHDVCHVGPDAVADAGYLVGEGDLRCQVGIRRVLDGLRSSQRGAKNERGYWPSLGGDEQRLEQLLGKTERGDVVAAEHDPVREEEILNSATFAQELRIRHDAVALPRAASPRAVENGGHPAVGTYGHCALRHEHVMVTRNRRQITKRAPQSAQVWSAVRIGRSADTQEDDVRLVHRDARFRGEPQPSPLQALAKQLGQTGLVEGHVALLEQGTLGVVSLECYHFVP
jgi:hypothetical protein